MPDELDDFITRSGRRRLPDYDNYRRDFHRRLDDTYAPGRRKYLYRSLAAAAALLLLLVSTTYLFGSSRLDTLLASYEEPLYTDQLSPLRGAAPRPDALLTATLEQYHSRDYAAATTGWQRLLDREDANALTYRFYLATTHYLNHEYAEALDRLDGLEEAARAADRPALAREATKYRALAEVRLNRAPEALRHLQGFCLKQQKNRELCALYQAIKEEQG